ncbi:hypothetical protein ACOSQ4_021807 [Xanthoceras sorbifolium]
MGYSKSIYPGNRKNETENPSANASEDVALGSMEGKNSDLDVGATENVEGDFSIDRSTEIGSNQQLDTACVNELMEFSVNVEEAVPDPSSIQKLLVVSKVLSFKRGKNEAFTNPISKDPIKSDLPNLSCSGVPGGKNDGSVVSSNSMSIPHIF